MVRYVLPKDVDSKLRELFTPEYLKDKVSECVEEVEVRGSKRLVNRCVKSSVQVDLTRVPAVTMLVYEVDKKLDDYFLKNKNDPRIQELLKYRVG